MTYRIEESVRARNYPDLESRVAHRTGYCDGYHRHVMGLNQADQPTQPYSAGYWEGFTDGDEKGPRR